MVSPRGSPRTLDPSEPTAPADFPVTRQSLAGPASSRGGHGATRIGDGAVRAQPMHPLLRSLRHARLALLGIAILATVMVAAATAPWITPHDPQQGDLRFAQLPPAWERGGNAAFPLGTDELGRDIASRVIYGARVSLFVGITVVLLAGVIGVTVGLVSGYYGGRIDDILMRLADIQLAVPFILFAIAVMAVLGPGLRNLIVVLGISSWVSYGRVVRGVVLSVREREFVEAARASGARTERILLRHIFPNVVAPVIVVASFAVASAILAEAALSFLGLGIPPAVPTWGGMVATGRDYIQTGQWWMTTFPGIAIMLTVLGVNVVGDWLRDYLDPRLRL